MTQDQAFQMFTRLLESPPSGVFMVAAGESISITRIPEYRFYRNTAIHEQYNLVCDYLDSLDTLPWWEGDNGPHFQNP
jgi:hypothetical protein